MAVRCDRPRAVLGVGAAAVLFLLLSGCGSCQRTTEPETDAGPAAAGRRPAGAPVLPGAAVGGVPKGRIAAPTMPQKTPIESTPSAGMPGAVSLEPAEELPAAEPGPQGDCVVVIDADPDFGEPSLRVSFSVEAQCTGGTPTYSWDFGDGSPHSSDPAPVHVYENAGEYTATLHAVAPDGVQASDDIDITVEESPVE